MAIMPHVDPTRVPRIVSSLMKREVYVYESLRSLERHKGTAQFNPTICDEVFSAVRDQLTSTDFDQHRGVTTWKNDLLFASATMVEHHLIKRPIHNTWEITDDGRKYLEAYPNVSLWEIDGYKGNTFVGVNVKRLDEIG